MLRSLFSGISGLHVNQTMLDVTGNNIANANTIGFKASTTVFQDTLSQMLSGATGDSAIRGGINPMQVGLGVQLAAVSTDFGQGSAQQTGRSTDLMIQGDGFFVVENSTEQLYTRAGSFGFDQSGTLVTPTGNRVMGYSMDQIDPATGLPVAGATLSPVTLDTTNAVPPVPASDPPVELVSYNIGPDGRVRGIFDDGIQRDLCQLAVANFTNPGGLEEAGGSTWRTSANSGTADIGVATEGGRGTLVSGALEMSNVDLAGEFTNLILAQRGFQASSRVITTSDQVLEELVNIKR